MKGIRQSTVEPVFGTLTQFMGLRKINTRGIANANKVMLMAGAAYNLKKLLKYLCQPKLQRRLDIKLAQSKAQSARAMGNELFGILMLIFELMFGPKWPKERIPSAK